MPALFSLLLTLAAAPQQVQAQAAPEGPYAAHLRELAKKVPDGFTVVVERPFVVIGDNRPRVVKRHAEGTVRWSVSLLKKGFFSRDPKHIIDIWLFKNKASYDKHTLKIFGERPGTPFGYYSERHRALIMNIGTGGGTLVHEIVHPFMEANFPGCPAWLNEGLGSLYEQSGQRGGKIVGFTNWRLAGLQKAIRRGRLPSFSELLATTEHEFYQKDPGTNYAQARYLLYYLQEQGLLRSFYRRFFDNRKKDPTGYRTLKAVLKTKDMDGFQKRWARYVLGLRFE